MTASSMMAPQRLQAPVDPECSAGEIGLRIERPDDRALAQWRALESRIGQVPLAVSADWTECWLKHYGDLVPARVVTAEQDGAVRGMCLLTDGVDRSAGPIPLRTRHIGTAGEPQTESVCVEHNGVLVDAEFQEQFVSQLARVMAADAGHDELHWDGFATAEFAPFEAYFPSVTIARRAARYFDLHAARSEGRGVLDCLGGSTRSNVRRTLRKYDQPRIEWADSIDRADDIFSELVALHQARWQASGQPGAFASRRFRDFQHDLLVRLLPLGRVVLFRMRSGAATVGCLLLLVDRNRLLDYLSGFAPFDRFPGPGIVTHYQCMAEALRRGFDAYDFLVGDKRHKENLSTHSQDLIWAVCRRRNMKNRGLDVLRRLKRRVRPLRGCFRGCVGQAASVPVHGESDAEAGRFGHEVQH